MKRLRAIACGGVQAHQRPVRLFACRLELQEALSRLDSQSAALGCKEPGKDVHGEIV
jgi:hypothetical protein